MQLVIPQKRLGPVSFFVCVLVIYLAGIISVDMYVPALPGMQKEFDVTASYLNLTMFVFFAVQAVGVLAFGPLSDRFGRRRMLVLCNVMFLAGSLGCMVSPGVEVLVAFRAVEAFAFGGVVTLCTALIQDAYQGEDLRRAQSALQSLILVGPAVAPFLGSLMLVLFDWRSIFAFLSCGGALAIVLSLLMTDYEVCPQRQRNYPEHGEGGISVDARAGHRSIDCDDRFQTLASEPQSGAKDVLLAAPSSAQNADRKPPSAVRPLLADARFVKLSLFMGFAGVPWFAFIAVVSYIVMDFFGEGYLNYSIVYAAVSLVSVASPFAYLWLAKRLDVRGICRLAIVLVLVTLASYALAGKLSLVVFAVGFLPYVLAEGIVRPMSYVVLLDQPADRVGLASSMVNFTYAVITSFATVVATLPWANFVDGLVWITGVTFAVMLLLHLSLTRSSR